MAQMLLSPENTRVYETISGRIAGLFHLRGTGLPIAKSTAPQPNRQLISTNFDDLGNNL